MKREGEKEKERERDADTACISMYIISPTSKSDVYCLGLHAFLYGIKFLFHSKVDSLAWSSRCRVLSDAKT